MKNKNKYILGTFLSILICSNLITAFLLINKIKQLDFFERNDQYIEYDLMQISNVFRGNIHVKEFDKLDGKHELNFPKEIGLNQIRIVFDSLGMVDTITSHW